MQLCSIQQDRSALPPSFQGVVAWQAWLPGLACHRTARLLQACKRRMPKLAAVCLTSSLPQGIHDAAWQARPAVLVTKIALLNASGQSAQAAATLSSALDHWRAGGRALWI